MTSEESSKFSAAAIYIAKEAGKVLMNYYGKNYEIKNKSPRDICTEADEKSEKKIINFLETEFSGHNIISEEIGNLNKKSDYTWIIDPLDGTIFFTKKKPLFSVSIGLKYRGDILLGAIYNPISNELFFAHKGKGAYLNGNPITVSSIDDLEESTVSIDYSTKKEAAGKAMDIMKILALNSKFIARFACEVIELADIACGRFDANLCLSSNLWDLAAAKPLIEEAGGKVTDLKGEPINIEKIVNSSDYKVDIFASNGKIHGPILYHLRNNL